MLQTLNNLASYIAQPQSFTVGLIMLAFFALALLFVGAWFRASISPMLDDYPEHAGAWAEHPGQGLNELHGGTEYLGTGAE